MANEMQAINEVTDREIRMVRILNAPRELVWKVFTEPEHLAKWWGPTGFSTSTKNLDLKPGGRWLLTMRGPDGRDYHNNIVYLEVVKPEYLVFKHTGEDGAEQASHHTAITFMEIDGKTKLSFVMTFKSAEELARIEKEYGAIQGGKETMGRLVQYLQQLRHRKT